MLGRLEDTLRIYLVDKAPVSIPSEWKEIIVTIAPWVLIISTLMSVKAVLDYFGFSSLVTSFGNFSGIQNGFANSIDVVIWIILAILQAMAIKGSFKRQKKAWKLVYYAGLVNSLRSLLIFDLIGFVVQALAFFYIIFQVRDYYS